MVTFGSLTQMMKDRHAYCVGIKSHQSGEEITSNPYLIDNRFYREWIDGYKDSEFLTNLTKN